MLHLLIALAVVVGVIWLLVISRAFRIVALILVAVGAVVYFSASQKAEQEQRQEAVKKEQERIASEAKHKEYCQAEQKRWSAVAATQIEIRGASLKQSSSYSMFNDEYDMTARLRTHRNPK
jgi:hypothetical protein